MRTWCVIYFFILLTTFVAQSHCQLCLKVKVYVRFCVCTICHILISSVLQQHLISSVFWGIWLQTWATCCNWDIFTCFIAALFELHSTAWGKPWNLLCSNKTPLGCNCAGVQGPNQQIRKKVLPPPAKVNDSFNFYQLKINCIFQWLPALMWLTFAKRTTPEKNAFIVTVCLTCTSFLSSTLLQIKCYSELFYHQHT